jgi:hypothetical protein
MQLILIMPTASIVVVLLGTSSAVLANMISLVMIGKINERTSENEKISYRRWGTEVRTRFKRLDPRNKLILLLDL